jgi:TPR repeat protein
MGRRFISPSLLGVLVVCIATPWCWADSKKYALLVGINQYDHPETVPPLKYAENDVIAMGDLLKKHGFENVLMTGQTAAREKNDGLKPTKKNIERELDKLLQKCQTGDILILGFSGHGIYLEEESYFCPQDAKPSLKKEGLDTLIAVKTLYDDIGCCPATKVLFIDACRNDPTRNNGLTDKTTPTPPKNALALFSCSIGEVSWEVEDYKHGMFFYYVLKGLGGMARDEEGNVTWSSLEVFVRKEVTRDTPKVVVVEGVNKTEQKPTRVGEESGEPLVLIEGDGTPDGTRRASLDLVLAPLDRPTARKNKISQGLQPQVVCAVPGGGGDRLGLRKDDVILSVNKQETHSTPELLRMLRQCTLGSPVELEVLREGDKRVLAGKYETTFSTREAFHRISELAKTDAAAQHALGAYYATGFGTGADPTQAFACYRTAADKGVVVAQRELGRCYLEARGVKKDEREAVSWFRRAADAGDFESRRWLGSMYERGTGVTKDLNEAKHLYNVAAKQGNGLAMYDLGLMYANGRFGEPDWKEAAQWFRKAADLGLADAQNWLGVLHQRGYGMDKDDAKALEWFRKAAEQGESHAECSIGTMYAEGRGVDRDDKEAIAWYRKSAAHGNALGLFSLGTMYEHGRGIDKSLELALECYRKAAAQGNEQAKSALARLDKSTKRTTSNGGRLASSR